MCKVSTKKQSHIIFSIILIRTNTQDTTAVAFPTKPVMFYF